MNTIKEFDHSDALWQQLSRQVRADAGDKCSCCARPSTLTHHIWGVKEAPDLRFARSNLIPLCDQCHAFVHALILSREAILTNLHVNGLRAANDDIFGPCEERVLSWWGRTRKPKKERLPARQMQLCLPGMEPVS